MTNLITWFKAKTLLVLIAILWAGQWFLSFDVGDYTIYVGYIQLATTALSWSQNPTLKRWNYHIWLAQDQLVNALLLGNCDVTISSKIGYMKQQGSKTAAAMAVVVDAIFYVAVGQKNHCLASIEYDEEHF